MLVIETPDELRLEVDGTELCISRDQSSSTETWLSRDQLVERLSRLTGLGANDVEWMLEQESA